MPQSEKSSDDILLAIRRLEAVTAIQNIMGHYEQLHLNLVETARTGRECFATWREDCSLEISDWGCIFGPEGICAFWESMNPPEKRGAIFYHALATPVMEIAGNGETAKVTWASPGFETMPGFGTPDGQAKSYWCWGRYGCDFIRNPETGEWRIWHMKWFRTIRNDFYKSWYDDAKNTLVGSPRKGGGFQHPDKRPSVFHEPYADDKIPHPFPSTPQPYRDYDGDFRWVFGGEQQEQFYGVSYPAYEKLYNVNYPTRV
jgi:hypothetical protein